MRFATALSRAVAVSLLALSPVPALGQQPDPDRRSVRLAAGVVAQGGTFGDDAPRDAARMFGPTFSAGIRRHPTHMVGLAFEAAFEPRPVRNPHFDERVSRVLLQIGPEIGRRVYVRPTAGGAVHFWSGSGSDSGVAMGPAFALAAGYRHTTNAGVRIQPEFVVRSSAEIGAGIWSAGVQVALSVPKW